MARRALSNVNLNLLVALEGLLATKSVSEAARRVSVTTSAMSHSLAALRELFGDPLLVRAGGRMVLTTWLPDSHVFGMFSVMKPYMPPPPTPAPASPFEWGRAERVRALLGKAFDLRFEQGISYYREPTAEAAWEAFSRGYGPTRALAESLDADRRAQLQGDFVAFHGRFATELGITVPRAYLVSAGTRI